MSVDQEKGAKPFSIFTVKPGSIPDVNLFVMRYIFKYLAETIFMALKLPDPVTFTLSPVKWTVTYDNEGRYAKRLKVSFMLEFEPSEDDVEL